MRPVSLILLLALLTSFAWSVEPGNAIRGDALKPLGERYEATVPDTLDLAERGRLAVHGLTSFLNPAADFAPYGHVYFNGNPAYMSDMPGGPPNWGKIAEALLMTRVMSGSEENAAIDEKTFKGMLVSTWMTVNPAAPTPVSVAMLALMTAWQLDPNPDLKRIIDGVADTHVQVAQSGELDSKPCAWYYDGPSDDKATALGVNGLWLSVFIQGRAIRPLVEWSALGGDRKYLDFSEKLTRFLVQPKFWTPEAAPKVVVGSDHGEFCGHHHSYTQALLGLLWHADAVNDARLKSFVRDSYEYMRTFGIARIGLFGEGCTTGDMTLLAIKLSDAGVGDYWEDVDQYVRNHLAELQITDAEAMKKAVDQMPGGRGKNDTTQGAFDPKNETTDNVIDRNLGVFLSDSTHPTLIPETNFLYTICCTGNCTRALYAAWESIVRCSGGVAQVNLLLNRASAWVDVESYLPYEGKVVLHNKTARNLSVRMPLWVDKKAVQATVNGQPAPAFWLGQYLVFDTLNAKDEVVLTFPVAESTETYTLKWKQTEFWKESTYPGPTWEPLKEPARYTCRFRGNTLVDISPRDEGKGLPLYQRDNLKATKAPTHSVTRFVAATVPKW